MSAKPASAETEETYIEVHKSIRAWIGVGIFITILLVFYAMVPYENDGIPAHVAIVFCVGLVLFTLLLGYLVVRNNIGNSSQDRWLRLIVTIAGLIGCLVFFALSYRQLANSVPSEFVGLSTMIDSVYFTVATSLTVGFGDVYASGQLARLMVIFQMVFTVIVLAAAGRSIAGILQLQADQRKQHNKHKQD